MRFLRRLCFLALLLAGCGGGSGSSTFAPSFVQQPLTAPDANRRGTLVIQLPLVQTRAIKEEVRTFRVTLSQNGVPVAHQEVTRSGSTQQEIRFDALPLGEYDVSILMISANGTVIGHYEQTVTVGADQPVLISDPAYQNSVPDFLTTRMVPSGYNTSWVVMADFDKDGHLDLLSTSSLPGSSTDPDRLYLALGTAEGSFQAPVRLNLGFEPRQVRVADVNEDGNLDILTATAQDVSMLLGNGDGTFQVPVSLALGGASGLTAVKVRDLNRDKHLDLITCNLGTENASVLLGSGDGTFSAAQNYPLGTQPFDIEAVDVNADGALDLVAANSADSVLSVYLGAGDGTFTQGTSLPAGQGAVSLAVAELNGDHHTDIVTANLNDNKVSVLLSNGLGGYGEPVQYPVGNLPVSVALGDANEDGISDLLIANYGSSDVSLLLGRGGGAFQPESRAASIVRPNMAVLYDFNEDDHLDIVAPAGDNSGIYLMTGNGHGEFQQPAPALNVGSLPLTVLSADFNEDGHLDLLNMNQNDLKLMLSFGLGDGTFQTPGALPLEVAPQVAVTGDFNEDRHLDVAVAGSGSVVTLYGHGDGTFSAPAVVLNSGATSDLVTGDINNDRHTDLVVGNATQNNVVWLAGTGTGTFLTPVEIPTNARPARIVTAQFNQDNNLDLAVLDLSQEVQVLFGDGNGNFPSSVVVPGNDPSGPTLLDLESDDVNQDGVADVILTQTLGGTVGVALSNGNGTFRELQRTPVAGGVSGIFSRDINGDGRSDLACTFEGLGSTAIAGIAVLLGQGDGSYGLPYFFFTRGQTDSVAFGDFNEDGALDMAVSNVSHDTLSILLAK